MILENRLLTKEDWIDYNELQLETFKGDEASITDFERMVENKTLFGFFIKKQLIGNLYLTIGEKYGHLNRIAIHPSFQGQSFGKFLMEFAIKYFLEFNLNCITLYVETNNSIAINLYKKFKFNIKEESWHYIIPIEKITISLNESLTSKLITFEDIKNIVKTFPIANKNELIHYYKKEQVKSANKLINFYFKDELIAFARFNRQFSGARPFFLKDVNTIDLVLGELIKYSLPDKRYIRLTFDDNKQLAKIFDYRDYKQHHHLYKMERLEEGHE